MRLAVRFCNPQLGTALVVLGLLTAGNTLQSDPWEEKVQMYSNKIASVFVIHFAQLPVAGQCNKMGWGGVNPETGIQRVDCGDSVADGAFDTNGR